MKEEMTEAAAAEAVREETAKTAGTAVAEKKETEENRRVAVASDPVAEKEDLAVRARQIMVR